MKAKDLKKVSETIENIYIQISEANQHHQFKCFIPHYIYMADDVKMKLIDDGYKVYVGDWDGVMINCLIIEW